MTVIVIMIFCYILGCMIMLSGTSGSVIDNCGGNGCSQDEQCGGVLGADEGHLEIRPSNNNCLWIIELQNTTGVLLELNSSTTENIMVIPEQNITKTNLKSIWIIDSKDTYQFEGKSFAILAPPRTPKTLLSWTGTGVKVGGPGVFVSTNVSRNSKGNLQWRHTHEGLDKVFWVIQPMVTGQLKWMLKSLLPICGQENPCESISFVVFQVKPNGNVSEIEKTCEGQSVGTLDFERNSQILILLHINAPVAARSSLEVIWKCNDPKDVEGIIAGSTEGLVVIFFNPPKRLIISPGIIAGVTFDWNLRRIYWSELGVGIKRANLDGSDAQVFNPVRVVSGIEVEPITGNLYYFDYTEQAIRLCSNANGDKCSTIVFRSELSYNVSDFVFHPSQGFLYWAIDETKLVRANLDGTNATVIMQRPVGGLCMAQYEDRLYWASQESKEIASCNLSGQDISTLANITGDPEDVATDGSTVYYTNFYEKTVSSITKKATRSTVVANLPGNAAYITLFGKTWSTPRSNPCEKAKCTHLCFLISTSSYRCLCPDHARIMSDGAACQ